MASPVVIPPAAPDPPAPAAPPPRNLESLVLLVLGVLLFTALALVILKWFPEAKELYAQMTVLLAAFAGALLLKLKG